MSRDQDKQLVAQLHAIADDDSWRVKLHAIADDDSWLQEIEAADQRLDLAIEEHGKPDPDRTAEWLESQGDTE